MEEKKEYQITFDWKNIITVTLASLGFIAGFLLLIFLVSRRGKTQSTSEVVISPAQEINMDNLKIEDIVVGNGSEVKNGDSVSVNYIGTLTDGKEFDSSYKRGQPFEFTVGSGEVIQGWDLGLIGMKTGGKRKLTIPPELGYGERGIVSFLLPPVFIPIKPRSHP